VDQIDLLHRYIEMHGQQNIKIYSIHIENVYFFCWFLTTLILLHRIVQNFTFIISYWLLMKVFDEKYGWKTKCSLHALRWRFRFSNFWRRFGKTLRNGMWELPKLSPILQAVSVSENWHFQLDDQDQTDFHFTNGHICHDLRPQYLAQKVSVTTYLSNPP